MGVSDEFLVEVHRGHYLEAVHRVCTCVARADGEVVFAAGDIDRVFPIRSLAKPFIAMELVRSGAADAFGLGEIELALASGSHDGEERHLAAVRVFLAKAGATEEMLLCGPAMEGRTVVGLPIANNCSGKHAAVLALCRRMDLDAADYIALEHPVQRFLREQLLSAFALRDKDATPAIDGCGMPIFGASLHKIACAYARFAASRDLAAVRVRSAMAAQPGYAGGWNGNLDTRITSSSRGAVLGKIGAEGLHGDAVVGKDLGIAVKVLDGNSRALPPVIARLLVQCIPGAIPERGLAELARPPVLNAAGATVGEVRLSSSEQLIGRIPMRRSEVRR